MRDMEDRMGREATSYQDTIGRLEADIAKMKVIFPLLSLSSNRLCLKCVEFMSSSWFNYKCFCDFTGWHGSSSERVPGPSQREDGPRHRNCHLPQAAGRRRKQVCVCVCVISMGLLPVILTFVCVFPAGSPPLPLCSQLIPPLDLEVHKRTSLPFCSHLGILKNPFLHSSWVSGVKKKKSNYSLWLYMEGAILRVYVPQSCSDTFWPQGGSVWKSLNST